MYFKFFDDLQSGRYSKNSWDDTVKLLVPIITEHEDKMYSENITKVNKDSNECILGWDVQFNRSQRSWGPAPLATRCLINHQQGENYGKLLYQEHLWSQ